ncbi:DUF86 domain-containing protein [Candidatus Woesearchaeota archaeon]|nr:DUF86 domain-containing protein [Candidatus Woesearchaeota archaeon]
MNRDLKLFIYNIMDSIENIESFLKEISKESFFKDRLRQSAVIRQLEVIGEATKNIPDSFRKKYPEIPWKKIVGLRDIIIHTYFEIDLDITWEIIKKDLPLLKKQVQNIKKDLQ